MSEEKKGFFSRLVEGLTKTRNNIMSGFDAIFSGFSNIDEDFYEELEEVLVMADLGIHTTENIIEELKRKVKEQHIKEPQACKQLLSDTIKEQMRVDEEAYQFEHQTSVVLVIGVNGVGKTTTIGKLAGQTAVCDSPSTSKLVERSDLYVYGDCTDCMDRHCNIPYGLLSQPTGRCGVWIGAVGRYQTDPENLNE